MNDKELISEARGALKATDASASLIARLADALEAATRELAVVSDAANEERLRSMTGKRNRARLNGDRYRLESDFYFELSMTPGISLLLRSPDKPFPLSGVNGRNTRNVNEETAALRSMRAARSINEGEREIE